MWTSGWHVWGFRFGHSLAPLRFQSLNKIYFVTSSVKLTVCCYHWSFPVKPFLFMYQVGDLDAHDSISVGPTHPMPYPWFHSSIIVSSLVVSSCLILDRWFILFCFVAASRINFFEASSTCRRIRSSYPFRCKISLSESSVDQLLGVLSVRHDWSQTKHHYNNVEERRSLNWLQELKGERPQFQNASK